MSKLLTASVDLMAACGRLIWQLTPYSMWQTNSIHLSASLSLLRAETRGGGCCVCVWEREELKPRDRWPRMAVWPLCVRSVCERAEWNDRASRHSLSHLSSQTQGHSPSSIKQHLHNVWILNRGNILKPGGLLYCGDLKRVLTCGIKSGPLCSLLWTWSAPLYRKRLNDETWPITVCFL